MPVWIQPLGPFVTVAHSFKNRSLRSGFSASTAIPPSIAFYPILYPLHDRYGRYRCFGATTNFKNFMTATPDSLYVSFNSPATATPVPLPWQSPILLFKTILSPPIVSIYRFWAGVVLPEIVVSFMHHSPIQLLMWLHIHSAVLTLCSMDTDTDTDTGDEISKKMAHRHGRKHDKNKWIIYIYIFLYQWRYSHS